MNNEHEIIDVVIIGAGFAGLSAAKYLQSKNIKCLVVEGRSRVGGRTLSEKCPINKWNIDLGGQWVGPLQERVLQLVKEFHLNLIEQTWIHQNPNHLGEHIGLISLNQIQIEQINQINNQWDEMALELSSVQDALLHPKSSQWSITSVQQFLEEHPLAQDRRVQQELQLEILTLTACDAKNVSLLYWLVLIRSVPGGIKSLDDGINGAQHYKLEYGSQQICLEIASKQKIIFNEILQLVNYQSNDRILLKFHSGLELECRRLLLGFSPTLLSKIEFNPLLSLNFTDSHMTMAKSIKTIFIYSNQFWKNKTINQTDFEGPCSNIFESNNPYALIGLILGEKASYWSEQNQDDLIQSISKQYSILYNSNEKPIQTFIQYWTKENLSQGCYAAVYSPTSTSNWIQKDKALVQQRIWLSSTEMAFEWIGYIEGAIESGIRFAKHIHQSF